MQIKIRIWVSGQKSIDIQAYVVSNETFHNHLMDPCVVPQ